MNESENRSRIRLQYSNNGEEEISNELMQVRSLLLSLPKAECPAGFEYRLNRRLQGHEVEPRAARSWVSGWLGVGLGFACAAVIALFALDFDGSNPTTPIAGNDGVTTPVQVADPVTEPASPTGMLAETDSAAKDKDPTLYKSENLQQVTKAPK